MAGGTAPLCVVLTVPSLAPAFGGPVVKARRLSQELERIGCPVTLVTVGPAPDAVGLPQLGRFHGTPIPRRLAALAGAISEADLVHVLGYRDPLGTAAARLARRCGVPYVVEPVGMHRRRLRSASLKLIYDRVVGRRLISGAACLIATSRQEAAELAEDGVPLDRIHLRPNGIDLGGLLPLPRRGALRRRLGIPARAPLVLSLGRIAHKKGLLHLARGLAALDGVWGLVAGPDAGDGTVNALLQLRERLGLHARLALIPEGMWGDERAQALADADVFCLPSASENFGNAAAEAAACGLPVVLSDRCGAAEWLDPRATLVVPYADARALVQALKRALGEPAISVAARQGAAALAQSLHWPEMAVRQLALYHLIVEARLPASESPGPTQPYAPRSTGNAGSRPGA